MEPQDLQKTYADLKPLIDQQIIDSIKLYAQRNQYGLSDIPSHEHSGTDTNQVNYQNLTNKSVFITVRVPGTNAALTTNYGVFYIAPYACNVLAIYEAHGTAGTDGGSVGVNIEKLRPGVALDSGTILLPTAFNLKAASNYTYQGTLTPTLSTKQLAAGDRLALKDTGTLTSVADVCVIIEITY
jgi:hypothetical protein